MKAQPNTSLQDLVSSINRRDQEMGDSVNLGVPLRQQLISELEACLVDWDHLTEYLQSLEAVLGGRRRPIRYDGFWSMDDSMEAVVERGLSVLDDVSLTELALDSVVLEELHHFVREAVFTDHWVNVAVQIFSQLEADAGGRMTSPLKELADEAIAPVALKDRPGRMGSGGPSMVIPTQVGQTSSPWAFAGYASVSLSADRPEEVCGTKSLREGYSPEELNQHLPWAQSDVSMLIRHEQGSVEYCATITRRRGATERTGALQIVLTFKNGESRTLELRRERLADSCALSADHELSAISVSVN